jgi:hypothetical protein
VYPLGPTDLTRGALRYVSRHYPAAFLAHRGVHYISVTGTGQRGEWLVVAF